MKLYKVVQKANTLIGLDGLAPLRALMNVLREHGLKIKGIDGDYYFIGSRKSTGIIARNNGHWEY
jgi:hypothetical protein